MSGDSKVQDKNIAYDLYREFQGKTLEYTYRGVVDSNVVEDILSLAESSFSDVKEQLLVRKKVYFVMVETLQNITRHQDLIDDPDFDQSGLFILRRSSNTYSITSGNLIKDDQIDTLRGKLEIVNSKNGEELKEYAREVLSKGTFSKKGGAGLGLIEMARKSGSKFKYRFVPAKYGYSTFYVNIEIPIPKGYEVPTDNEKQIMDNTQKYHKMLQDNHVALNFSGQLNQMNLKNLLNILSRQINSSKALKSKIHNVMIELLQNVLQHAYRKENEAHNGCFGMFYIRQDKEHIKITTANHIENVKIPEFNKMLKDINETNRETRNELSKSADFKGIGYVTILNKSKHQYDYQFYKLDNNCSLFALSAYLDKENDKDITM